MNRAYKKHYNFPNYVKQSNIKRSIASRFRCSIRKENCMCSCRREFCGQFALINSLYRTKTRSGQFRTLEAKSAQASRIKRRWGRNMCRFYIFLLSSSLPPNPLFTWTVTIYVPGAFRQNGSLWNLLDSWQMNGWLCRYLCDQHVGVVAKRDSAAEFFSRSSSLVEPFFVAMFCLAQSLVDQVCADQYLPYFTS